ncbi:MAG: rRNA adenine N-6-methyltransferase family protein [bacterium]
MHHLHFNDKLRKTIVNTVVEALKLSNEDVVFDIGSGDGLYSSEFAKRCKKVIAIDKDGRNFQNEYYLDERIIKIQADICDWIKINDFSEATHIFFSNSFHDIECQDEVLKVLSESLREGAYLDMVEFNLRAVFGPPKGIRFTRERLKTKVEAYHFLESSYIEFENHYFISFKKF